MHNTSPIQFAASLCTHKHCAIDGGAHRGLITKLLLELRFEKVVAIEPGPSFNRLKLRFQGASNVTILNAALGHVDKMVWFGGTAPGKGPKLWYADADRPGPVHMIRFDDQFTLDKLDLVKLDLEGGELNALKGMERTLLTHRPIVVCETADWVIQHKDGPGRAALFDYMASLGYKVVGKFEADSVWGFQT